MRVEVAGRVLELIEGDHFVPYDGLGFVRSSTAMRDFLVEYL